MASDKTIKRTQNWYAKLLRCYPKSYRERFGEGMEQTFHDLCQEYRNSGKGILTLAFWAFVDTSTGIIEENLSAMTAQNRRILGIFLAVTSLLLIPLVAMQFTEEVNWTLGDFVVMGAVLFGVGFAYEFIARRSDRIAYRVACGVGLVAAFLLFWVNGAVGIIGNEGQPANLMYGAVFAVGFIGAIITRLRSHGMARTLFAMALTQALVPFVALLAWPNISWGAAGASGVLIINTVFAALFIVSALLFRRAGVARQPSN